MSRQKKPEICAGGIILRPDATLVFVEKGQGLAFSKGHLEKEDEKNLRRTARREVYEETGYKGRIIANLGGFERQTDSKPNTLKHITMFLMVAGMDSDTSPYAKLDETPVIATLYEALDSMHYRKERAFLAAQARKITRVTRQGLRLAS